MSLNLNIYQTLAAAIVVYYVGVFLRVKISVLRKYCIPAPVVGGILFAIINCILYTQGIWKYEQDTIMQNICMMLFFTSVGYTASISLIKRGGVIHAVAHITGGGITENLNRVLPGTLDAAIDRGTWDVPPIISYVVEKAGLTPDEAYKTFNMGVGMCVVVDPRDADEVTRELTAAGERVFPVGEIVAGTGKVVYR